MNNIEFINIQIIYSVPIYLVIRPTKYFNKVLGQNWKYFELTETLKRGLGLLQH